MILIKNYPKGTLEKRIQTPRIYLYMHISIQVSRMHISFIYAQYIYICPIYLYMPIISIQVSIFIYAQYIYICTYQWFKPSPLEKQSELLMISCKFKP